MQSATCTDPELHGGGGLMIAGATSAALQESVGTSSASHAIPFPQLHLVPSVFLQQSPLRTWQFATATCAALHVCPVLQRHTLPSFDWQHVTLSPGVHACTLVLGTPKELHEALKMQPQSADVSD
jgi:hypothetical protein